MAEQDFNDNPDFLDDAVEVLNDYPEDEDEARELGLLQEDDPFYDEDADERDSKWVQKKFKFSSRDTDAILNCPACFQTVCWDCQKHEEYEQYRAMFVQNCRVYLNRQTRPRSDKRSTKEKASTSSAARSEDAHELYHPVHCNHCNTELGARDSDEVIHFFHVIASQP